MKKILFIFYLAPLVLYGQNFPNENPLFYQKEIKLNYLYVGLGVFQIQYENYIKEGQSYNLNLAYVDFLFYNELTGFNVGAGVRNYFTPENRGSFYLEPSVNVLYLEDKYFNEKYNTVSCAVVLGRKRKLGNRFTLDVYLGPSIHFGFLKSGNTSTQKLQNWQGPLNGIFFKGGVTAGYRFN
jgi:hypothetical protein